jgi:putative ABC transport system permease protein
LNSLRLMLRMLRRDWRAGELTVLGLALVVAVASLTSVSFLTDRIGLALIQESHQLLGGDLLLSADHPFEESIRHEAQQRGLKFVDSVSFPSMASAGEVSQLAEIKAVAPGYPLRGALRKAPAPNTADAETADVPERGTVWLDERLTAALNLKPGDRVKIGASALVFAAVLTQEPDRAMSVMGMAPHLLMQVDDLAATGLIQPASRVAYRLHLAGKAQQVESFASWVKARLGRGERLEDMSNARPEVRAILDRAQRFLRLAALLAVVLAAVATGFAADRYMRRHLDGCAVMRCLGASQAQVLAIHGGEFLLFGLLATLAGCIAGFIAQWGLQRMLAGLFFDALPPSSWQPWAHGLLIGLTLIAGFAAPPLLRLRKVPTLRVLRREWASAEPLSLGAYAFGCLALAGLMLWIAGELPLGAVVIAGFGAALGIYALLARALLFVIGRLSMTSTLLRLPQLSGLRLGLANLRRHAGASVLQAAALGLGLTALLLLTVARQGMLESWRNKMPPDAPNHFIINIQQDQQQPLREFFRAKGLPMPQLEPMIRGRLVAINDKPITPESFADERARHLVDREFNLSWTATLPPGNQVTAGRWHGDGKGLAADATEFSVEQGLAETLHLVAGDRLVYEIAGERIAGRITSLRRLEWDSLRVNFFVITPPGALEHFPASAITSFHLPEQHDSFINELVRAFPNLTVIDVAALVRQLQAMLDQVARAVQAVFGFALLAGLVVLYAALQATHDERRRELALLRALGARHWQLRGAILAEFAMLGAIAGLLAGCGSAAIGWALARFAFHLDYQPAGTLLPLGLVAGAIGIALAGGLGTAGALRRPALEYLRGNG